jgi:hypothetical protein
MLPLKLTPTQVLERLLTRLERRMETLQRVKLDGPSVNWRRNWTTCDGQSVTWSSERHRHISIPANAQQLGG